jgi:tetratricopeptide (TPR) repeat protein
VNKSAFLRLIRNASSISAQEAEELEELVVNFPYCQTAHLLIAKSAYDRGSMLSNQKLRKAASYATNRQLLKKLIYTTSPDVTLREVQELAGEETPVQAAEFVSPLAEGEPAPLPSEPKMAEQRPEVNFAETDQTPDAAPASDEHMVGEPEIGELVFEKADLNEAEALEEELFFAEATTGEEALGDPETLEAAVVQEEEEPQVFAFPPRPAYKEAPVPAADFGSIEPEEDDLQDELAGLLYIDRIMPYRHLLPEHAETLPEEAEADPIPLAQFANPSLTAEEVTALEALIKTEDAPEAEEVGLMALEEAAPGRAEFAPGAETAVAPWDTGGPEKSLANEEEQEKEPVGEDTLSRFDAFLFHPEKDSPEGATQPEEEEEITATYPADVIDRIYAQNQLGYWMNSSRLGESLEVKNELTSAYPFHFHPELILEYVQLNEVEKQVKPAESPLDQQLDLIDQFLKMNPRLKQFGDAKIRPEPHEDLSMKSSKIKKNLASENLANIFLKQGKIKKAIKIYEHLIVKIPEKKAYFADQIIKLKNLTP